MNMQVTRTMKLKLDIPVELVLPTIVEYTKAYNHICSVGWSDKDINGVSLHHKTYEHCKATFGLPSQLNISARMRATESVKSALTAQKKLDKKKSKPSKKKPKKEKVINS